MNLQLANFSSMLPLQLRAAPQNPGREKNNSEFWGAQEINAVCWILLLFIPWNYIYIYYYMCFAVDFASGRSCICPRQMLDKQHGCRHLSLALRPFYSLLYHITLVTYSLKQTLIFIRPSLETNQKFMKTIYQRVVCLWWENDHFLLSFCRTTLVLFRLVNHATENQCANRWAK